jgi:hypothetical protein
MKKIEQPATRSALQHPLLDAVRSDEPKHIYLLRLSNPVGPIQSLQIRLWIPKVLHALVMRLICVTLHVPVAVVENNNIGSGQIDTKSSSASREQERKMNFSLPGRLYSLITLIQSSCAVPPSIRQYPI